MKYRGQNNILHASWRLLDSCRSTSLYHPHWTTRMAYKQCTLRHCWSIPIKHDCFRSWMSQPVAWRWTRSPMMWRRAGLQSIHWWWRRHPECLYPLTLLWSELNQVSIRNEPSYIRSRCTQRHTDRYFLTLSSRRHVAITMNDLLSAWANAAPIPVEQPVINTAFRDVHSDASLFETMTCSVPSAGTLFPMLWDSDYWDCD